MISILINYACRQPLAHVANLIAFVALDNAAIFYLSRGSANMMLAAEAIEAAGKLPALRRPTKEEERKDSDATFAGKRETGYLATRIKRDRQDIASDWQLERAFFLSRRFFETEMTEIHFSFWAILGEIRDCWDAARFSHKTKKPSISTGVPGFSSVFLLLVFSA